MELDPDARSILDLTREARTPSEQDKQRVERLLATSVGAAALSGAATASGSAVAKSAVAGLAFKWTAGAAVLILSVAAAGYIRSRPAPAAASSAEPRALPAAPKPAPAAVPVAQTPPPEAAPAPALEPPEPVNAEKSSIGPGTLREKARAREGTLNQELDLLHEAQAKWRNRNPTAALSLLAQHREKYPRSELGPEREALRVLSLCAAGRIEEARDVAQRSFKNAPRSPLRTSVEESCVKR